MDLIALSAYGLNSPGSFVAPVGSIERHVHGLISPACEESSCRLVVAVSVLVTMFPTWLSEIYP